MVANTNAADRIAALRNEYAKFGEDVTGLSDAEVLFKELDRTNAESRRHENNYSNLLQDQVKNDRAVRSAAARAAIEDRRAWAGIYLGHIVRESGSSINEVINRAAEMPDGRVPVERTRDLKAAAERAKWQMSGLVGHRQNQFDDARRQNPEIRLVEKQREEILRLREFITAQAGPLHAKYGRKGSRENNWRCECPGCELIRATDDRTHTADEATAA